MNEGVHLLVFRQDIISRQHVACIAVGLNALNDPRLISLGKDAEVVQPNVDIFAIHQIDERNRIARRVRVRLIQRHQVSLDENVSNAGQRQEGAKALIVVVSERPERGLIVGLTAAIECIFDISQSSPIIGAVFLDDAALHDAAHGVACRGRDISKHLEACQPLETG